MENQASLQKQLENMRQDQQKLVRSFKRQLDFLSQFIVRMGAFYNGVHSGVDHELQELNNRLNSKANFALVQASIQKLDAILRTHGDQVGVQSKKTNHLLTNAIKELQKHQQVPQNLQSQINALLSRLNGKDKALANSLPCLEQAIDLYQQVLSNSPGSANQEDNTDKLHKDISSELQKLLSELSPGSTQANELKQIRQQLSEGVSTATLLECCLVIIRTILAEVIQERDYAEKFISGMHDSLNKINGSLVQTIEDATNQYQQKAQSHERLRQQVSDMDEVVSQSEDLQQLKIQASEYMQKINATLADCEQHDQDEQLLLMNLLKNMQQQLTELEQQANRYKVRLQEQQNVSHIDTLTQTPNRAAYNERIQQEYKRFKRYGSPLCMALLDIDHFKRINDDYGHSAGDKTLQVLVKQIQKCLRDTDFLARWGGEEFVLLLPETSASDAKAPLETIRQKIQSIPFKFRDQSVTISISIGATQFGSNDTIDSAFERTDKALYKAKSDGRNRCILLEA